MIITDKSHVRSIDDVGDKTIITHAKDVSASLKQAAEVKMFSDNGWSKERSVRQIGCIDELAYQKLITERPEVLRDMNKLKEWLMTEEGRPWRTVDKIDTGRSGHIIIK